jgi:hypothetical protein
VFAAFTLCAFVVRRRRRPAGLEMWAWRIALPAYVWATLAVAADYWTQWGATPNAFFGIGSFITVPGLVLALLGSTLLGIAPGDRQAVPAVAMSSRPLPVREAAGDEQRAVNGPGTAAAADGHRRLPDHGCSGEIKTMAVMQVIEFGPPHRAGALGQRRVVTCRGSKRAVRRDLLAWGSFRPGPVFSGGVLGSGEPAMRDSACPGPGPRT